MTRMVLAGIFVIATTVALAISLAWGADDQAELAKVARENCLQIEELKREQRAEAILSYRHLARSLRLLGVEVTPEIREASRMMRDRRLRRFEAHDC